MSGISDKKTIKVKYIKSIEEDKDKCKDKYMNSSNEDRARRMKELEKYHGRLTVLREEEKRLKESIIKLKGVYAKMKEVANGISNNDLWKYCSNLNNATKGKYKED